jgi:hypothetical protein
VTIQSQRQALVMHSSNRSGELLLEDNTLCSQAVRNFLAIMKMVFTSKRKKK